MHVLGIDTDPDRPDPDLHALDARCLSRSGFGKMKSDPIRIHSTVKIR
jgi:hypothetical protein